MSDEPRKRGLGRGLSALLDDDGEDMAAVDRMRDARDVPVEQLSVNPFQPRRNFAPEDLSELSDSIKEKGILVPILVRRVEDEHKPFQIVAGERRWRAAQMAQLHQVPVLVREFSDKEALEAALIENIQRQDLTPIEEATGYKQLMEDFDHTQADVGQMVGKSRSHVANILRLLQLPEQVRGLLESGDLTPGHARTLIKAEDPVAMAAEIMRSGLNVRKAERLARDTAAGRPPEDPEDANIRDLERQLSEKLGLKVTIRHQGERGEVKIAYSSLEQFDDILDRLNKQV